MNIYKNKKKKSTKSKSFTQRARVWSSSGYRTRTDPDGSTPQRVQVYTGSKGGRGRSLSHNAPNLQWLVASPGFELATTVSRHCATAPSTTRMLVTEGEQLYLLYLSLILEREKKKIELPGWDSNLRPFDWETT